MNRYMVLMFVLLFSSFSCWSDEPAVENNQGYSLTQDLKNLPDDFQSLIVLRKKMIINQNALEEQLRKLEEERKYLDPSTDDVDLRISELQRRILREQSEIEKLEAKGSLTDDERRNLQQLKSYIEEDKSFIDRLERDKKRIISLDSEINLLSRKLDKTFNDMAPIEQKIANLLNLEEERNSFRTLVSVAFCVLVAIVIIGFYVIAIKKEQIAESIFSGEKGIQFVTIFLIVIAIILFGIMGILESKELSALLGGLSGYILGRVGGQSKQAKAE